MHRTNLLLNYLHLHERIPMLGRCALLCCTEVKGEDVAVVLVRCTALPFGVEPRRGQGATITHRVLALGIAVQQRT